MLFTGIVLVVGIIMLNQSQVLQAGYLSDVESLYTQLLSNYNKNVRPLESTNKPMTVNLTFNLLSIKEFDEVNGKFSVAAYFTVTWVDSRMTWNPYAYNWTFSMELPQTAVWTPQITVTNPYDKLDSLGKDFLSVQYYYNGFAVWLPGDIISSTCSVDVTKFPFDKQTCSLMLICWGFGPGQIILQATSTELGLSFYTKHGTWELLDSNSTSQITNQLSLINVFINMKRRPAYYIINIILPIIFMIILNTLVFILPVECGERLSYSITVLLALAVFLTLVGDNLPKTSEPMSILSYFLLAALILSAVICFLTVLGLNIYYKQPDTPIPRCLARLVLRFTFCKRKQEVTKVIPIQDKSSQSNKANDGNTDYAFEDNYDTKVTWPEVSGFLDKVSILFSIVGLIVSSVIFFVSTMK